MYLSKAYTEKKPGRFIIINWMFFNGEIVDEIDI